ncbi:MAG TPA: 50S ribosomal protein L32 [Coleofasciculaceae cyanobacterium]
MPVPKQRQGHARQMSRRANWKATLEAQTTCPHCGTVKLPHRLCTECGFYKDRVVSEKLHTHHEH